MQYAIRSAFRNHISSVASLAVIVSAIVVGRAAIRCADSASAAERYHGRIADHRDSTPTLAPLPLAIPCPHAQLSLPAPNDRSDDQLDQQPVAITAIHKTGPYQYTIDRSAFEAALNNPQQFVHAARIVPSMTNGVPSGFKLYAIKPSSVFAALGLLNGDMLGSINDIDLTSAEKALTVYSTIKATAVFHVNIVRRGVPLTLTYTITPVTNAE
jgi:hypothetical protein